MTDIHSQSDQSASEPDWGGSAEEIAAGVFARCAPDKHRLSKWYCPACGRVIPGPALNREQAECDGRGQALVPAKDES